MHHLTRPYPTLTHLHPTPSPSTSLDGCILTDVSFPRCSSDYHHRSSTATSSVATILPCFLLNKIAFRRFRDREGGKLKSSSRSSNGRYLQPEGHTIGLSEVSGFSSSAVHAGNIQKVSDSLAAERRDRGSKDTGNYE